MNQKFETEFVPDWDTIQRAWEPCMDHFSQRGVDPDAAYSLCMVVLELLENSVKYGSFERASDRIHLAVTVRGDGMTSIEVRTPVAEDDPHVRRLDQMVQWIRGFQHPFEAYVERLKQVASSARTDLDSGLGLVRIAYEGQCLLDFFVDDRNVLTMSAVYQPAAHATRTVRRSLHLVEERSVANAK